MKVELPSTYIWWVAPIRVGQGDSHLYDFEQVNIAAHRLIHVVVRRSEVSYWTRYDSRELCILQMEERRLLIHLG